MSISTKVIALIIFLTFFTVGILTLPGYGINWDTVNHLPRGQAYLHYFLTGKTDYSDLQQWSFYWQKPQSLLIDSNIPKSEVPARSMYQNDATPFSWFMVNDGGGHPPLSDILSSVFNRVLFGNLRLINDIDSYRVYGVFLAAVLVTLIFLWIKKYYGKFAGIITALSIAMYPLFWAESHFNTEKDIPETAFISFFLFSLFKGVIENKWKWIILAGCFLGLAIGTKFNVLFVFFIVIPWLVISLFPRLKNGKFYKLFWSLLMVPVIGLAIFIGSWPYLWQDSFTRVLNVIKFYKTIGLTANINPDYVGFLGINTYPLQWILFTTPLIVLILSFTGIIFAFKKWKTDKNRFLLLLLLWLAVPILRVTIPGTTVYGGIRQIMEYIPPLAMLSGIGAFYFRSLFPKNRFLVTVLLLIPFIFLLFRLIAIHPNENVYFNPLIKGLQGAKEKNVPAWGNSFGATYRQAASWIDQNAELGSRVVLSYELLPNIPKIWFREDLVYSNTFRSGYLRQGEYAITLVHEGTGGRSYYDEYLENFIEPVYEVKVDNVPILKIWKNDGKHLKYKLDEKVVKNVKAEKSDSGLKFDLGQVYRLSRLEISYNEDDCRPLKSGTVQISPDGKNWGRIPEPLVNSWKIPVLGEQPKDGNFVEPFVGQEAQYIELLLSPADTCLKNIKEFGVYYFDNLR